MKSKTIKFTILSAIAVLSFVTLSSEAQAQANLRLSPTSGGPYNAGQPFSVEVYLDTNGEVVYMTSTYLSFPVNQLSITSIDSSGIGLNPFGTDYDNTSGLIEIINADFFGDVAGQGILLGTINFQVIASPSIGDAAVDFDESLSAVYFDDGAGGAIDILTRPIDGATYTISSGSVCGDETADIGEDCDGADLKGENCVTQGYDSGDLACNASCNFDTTGCLSVYGSATLSISPASGSNFDIGDPFTVTVSLDTDGEAIDGVDLDFLNFDEQVLQVTSVSYNPPLLGSGAETSINSIADMNSNGIIDFTQTTESTDPVTQVVVNGTLLTINFTSVLDAPGGTDIYFNFNPADLGNTEDSNVNKVLDEVRTIDILGSADPVTYIINEAPSLAEPVRSGGLPDGLLDPGTTDVTLSLTTNVDAACSYSESAGVAYALMSNNMIAASGGTSHSASISGLSDGRSYNYYVKCQTVGGLANDNDFVISFSIDEIITRTLDISLQLPGKITVSKVSGVPDVPHFNSKFYLEFINSSGVEHSIDRIDTSSVGEASFTISTNDLPIGDYDVRIRESEFLHYLVAEKPFSWTGIDASIYFGPLMTGDFTPQNAIINGLDHSLWADEWNSIPTDPTNWKTDINGDGVINSMDHSFINSNWYKTGANYVAP